MFGKRTPAQICLHVFVSQSLQISLHQQTPGVVDVATRLLEMALRDTMVTAYSAALEKQMDAHPPDETWLSLAFGTVSFFVGLHRHPERVS